MFGIMPAGAQLAEGWINLHLLIWKQLIYALTIVETEGAKFEPHTVWQAAWQRFERKVLAKQENLQTLLLRADSRGDEPPDLTDKCTAAAPIASFDAEGKAVWNDEIADAIRQLATSPKSGRS